MIRKDCGLDLVYISMWWDECYELAVFKYNWVEYNIRLFSKLPLFLCSRLWFNCILCPYSCLFCGQCFFKFYSKHLSRVASVFYGWLESALCQWLKLIVSTSCQLSYTLVFFWTEKQNGDWSVVINVKWFCSHWDICLWLKMKRS